MGKETEFNSLCEKVRYAVSFEEELSEEMREHIENCDECRAYLEQTGKMASELSALNVTTLNKNGMSVADSVMCEVKKQAVFTSGKPVKTRAFVRHAGLIAACLVLVVMAIPVIKGTFGGAKSEDAAYKYKQNGAIEYETADEECLPESDAGEMKLMTSKAYNDTDNTEAVTDGTVFDTMDSAQMTESYNSAAVYKVDKTDKTDIYAYSEDYAKQVCVTCGLEYGRFESLTYTGDDKACAIYMTKYEEQIVLQLEKVGNEWEVVLSEVYL